MKRFIFVLAGLLTTTAWAEIAPFYPESDTDVVDTDVVTDEEIVAAPVVVKSQNTISRAMPASSASVSDNTNVNTSAVASGRTTTTRGTAARGNTSSRGTSTRGVGTRGTIARTITTRTTPARSGVVARAASGVSTATLTTNTGKTYSVDTDAITNTTRALYNANRVGVRGASAYASRVPTVTVTNSTVSTTGATISTAGVTTTAAAMDELAQMTDYCKAQYTECMDNFCNVLDDNQGRCSCSSNLKNYEKTELALKKATEELQDVAQKIQYIGLTADEITTIFRETEAEAQMKTTTDSTQLKNDLERIKGLIVDVRSGASSVSDTTNGVSVDLSGLLDFSFSSTGFDLSSLFGNTTNTASISNQRGEQLYKTASARCKAAVLNACQSQGVDISIVTNTYDMEIDKQCIAYERSLDDSNTQMASTVRNAKGVLQKARLMVAQQKNSYDLRGCVNALDNCMQDEYVCGADYEYCLDPSGKYIANGDIVVGGVPGISGGEYASGGTYGVGASYTGNAYPGLYSVWDYSDKNTWSGGNLGDFIETSYEETKGISEADATANMYKYLRKKIGYITDNRAVGMCAGVLNKCQDYTYTTTGSQHKYNDNNVVIKNYLERALIQIKAKQDQVIADYAESCISDVWSCLSSNNYVYYANTSTNTTNNPSEVAIRACLPVINTCKSVTQGQSDTTSVYQWLDNALGSTLSARTVANLAISHSSVYNTTFALSIGDKIQELLNKVNNTTQTDAQITSATSGFIGTLCDKLHDCNALRSNESVNAAITQLDSAGNATPAVQINALNNLKSVIDSSGINSCSQ